MRTPRYYRANTCAVPHHFDEYGRCTVCHCPDPTIRLRLPETLASLVPEAGINAKAPVAFSYPSATDFIGRNTESFCARIMAFFKYLFNFFTQLFGMLK